MKLIIAAICAAFILLAGCAGTGHTPAVPYYSEPAYKHPIHEEPPYEAAPSYEDLPDTPGHTHSVLTPFPGSATLDHASEEEMAAYPDAPRIVQNEDGFWMVFRFGAPVSNVVHTGVVWTDFDEDTGTHFFEPGVIMHEVGDLAARQPFFFQGYGHIGTMPGQAIGFTYTDGVRYYIPFEQEQKFGKLVLHKQWAFTVNG